ncbi:MAG TPA: insulinase family protein [Thioalkalivibrio sp.]|nr:insulinase family protein [Thioalkalivibrio sp.]
MRTKALLAVLLALSLLVPLLSAAGETGRSIEDTHEFILKNGMKVVVKEDHRAPVVVQQVWYKVGSSYEYGGITGISHVLEHMMFKGTSRYPNGTFSEVIAEQGGRENAFTSRDYTAYYQVLAADRLEIAMRLEADRMRNLLMREDDFQRERAVVQEERRLRTEDNPTALTYERFQATAYLNSPYGDPVIGWMQDLESLTLDDLKAWYDRWYAPNNATLVVVGDVDPDEVRRLARRYYGTIRAREVAPPKPRQEVPQQGERRVTVKAPAELPYVLLGYKVPVVLSAETEWEPYALEVLAGVLDGGSSARLSRNLVRGREIAASAGAGYNAAGRLEGLFMLDGTPAPGQPAAAIEAALRDEIRALREAPVTGDEIERVKAQVVAGEIYQRDSIQHQAMVIGTLETVGLDWRLAEDYAERIRAVTPEQVQAVARKYLVDDRLTVAHLDPQPIDPDNPPSRFDGHLR